MLVPIHLGGGESHLIISSRPFADKPFADKPSADKSTAGRPLFRQNDESFECWVAGKRDAHT